LLSPPPHTLDRVDEDLVALARSAAGGDSNSLAQLVTATHADVWRLCAYLVDRQAADDLTQETFLRAHRSLGSFRGEAPVRSWLLTIARRVCAAEIDARERRRDLALQVRPLIRPAVVETTGVDIGLLIAALDPGRRLAFVLTQVLGCDYREAASICGCPVGTIRSRVARARADLIAAMSAADTVPTRSQRGR
jgi:RNA polymerase sigma-70 factor (ECF subfamily)